MQRERIEPLRIIWYIVVLVFIFVLETANGMPMRLFGYRIDILPYAVVSIAILDGPVEGASMGFAAGVLYDIASSGAEGLYPIVYMLFGIGAGMLGQRFLRRIYPSALLLGTCSMLILGFWRLFVEWVMQRLSAPLLYFQSICGQALVAALFSPIAYLLVRTVSRRFTKPSTKTQT